MNNRIFYHLGCTCDPQVTLQQAKLKNFCFPSVFAGCIQLQQDCLDFIPKYLFNGYFEEEYFNLKNWHIFEILNFDNVNNIENIANVWKNSENNEIIKYYSNTNEYEKVSESDILLEFGKYTLDKTHVNLYNDKLHLINLHAFDKIPGVNPLFQTYQRNKLLFFKENQKYLYYLIYLHRSVNKDMLLDFQQTILDLGINPSQIIIFNRGRNDLICNEIKFNQIMIPDDVSSKQSNICYSYQQIIMAKTCGMLIQNIQGVIK